MVTHILPLTSITRRRVMPIPAKVLVRKGQKVSATDPVAEAMIYSRHLLLDVAKGLGVAKAKVEQYLQCQEGDLVAKGDILAGPAGFTRRILRSPGDGKVVMIWEGQLLLAIKGKTASIQAGLPGEVTELVEERGAVVQTTGALIQGVWGNGRIDFGMLVNVADQPDQILSPAQLDVSLRGSILAAAMCQNAEMLHSAAELPVRGLILSSMDGSLRKDAEQAPYPIILIEGFGKLPMNPLAHKLLKTNEGREAALNAEAWHRFSGSRPEVVIPLPDEGGIEPTREVDRFRPGQTVRIMRTPYASHLGSIIRLVEEASFPSGLRSAGAYVHLESGENLLLPLANLELIQ